MGSHPLSLRPDFVIFFFFFVSRHPDLITDEDREVMALLEEEYLGGPEDPPPHSAARRIQALVEIYQDSYFRAIGARMHRAYARGSGRPAFEYLYSHRATFSLYNILSVPLWKSVPMVRSTDSWIMLLLGGVLDCPNQ